VLSIFSMGISSGFPLTLILSTLGFWLAQEGISAKTIGLLSLATLPYSIKFIWAPLIDRLQLPGLGGRFGRRRSWLFFIQSGLFLSVLFLGSTNPAENAGLTALAAVLVGFMSASQDIVLDAYRIEILKDEELPAGAAMIQYGYRIGNLIAGAGGLALAAIYGWHVTYYILAFMVLFGAVPALLMGEPATKNQDLIEQETEKVAKFLDVESTGPSIWTMLAENIYLSVIVPFKEFMTRKGWLLVLLFIILLKVGDGMASVMTSKLITDLGFTNEEIIFANKSVGFVALMIGVFVGGLVLKIFGTYRGLLFSAVLMAISNLSFAVLAELGHSVPFLAFTIGFENLATGMGGTVAIAYLSGLCNLAYTATQYALLSSLASVGRGFLAAPSGFGYDEWGAAVFFIFTTFAAIPAIILLMVMKRRGFVTENLRSGSHSTSHSSGIDS